LMQGGNALRKQAITDFGTPEADSRVLLLRLMDHSGSSRGVKQTIVEQVNRIAGTPSVTAHMTAWRYSLSEEVIYSGVSSERLFKPALKEYYENVTPPTTKGTHLGRALEAAERTITAWRKVNPQSVVVMTIGTDGGIEDSAKARKVAARLAQQDIYVLVHGTLVEQRLREQIINTLQPLKTARRLFVCNQKDFDQVYSQFHDTVEYAVKQKGKPHKAISI